MPSPAVGLVEQQELRDLHAVGVPGDVGLDGGGGALDRAGSQRQVAGLPADELDFDVQAVLF